jgi:hypothetical protein
MHSEPRVKTASAAAIPAQSATPFVRCTGALSRRSDADDCQAQGQRAPDARVHCCPASRTASDAVPEAYRQGPRSSRRGSVSGTCSRLKHDTPAQNDSCDTAPHPALPLRAFETVIGATIGIAVGLSMKRFDVDYESAFSLLRRIWSRSTPRSSTPSPASSASPACSPSSTWPPAI